MRTKRSWNLGVKNPNSKLNEDDVAAIVLALYQGRTQRALARDFGVSQHTIHSIKTGRTWK